jgi:hypothetical protein
MAKNKKEEKILRVGIVQGGRIIEERLLRHKEAITIGQAPKNKFMIPSPRVPIAYTLIDVKGGKYVLCFEKGMLGKILVDEEILDLKTIAKRRLAQRKDAKFRFPLADTSRGKIVLGDVTLLFQFVTPPPEVAKLQLPAEAKGAWWRSIDKALMATFLISFLLLGGSGGYSDFWWRYTGRYLAPTKKTKSTIFQTLVKASKAKDEEKKDEKKGEAEAEKEKGISEDAGDDDKKPVEPSETEAMVAEGDVPVDTLGSDDALGDLEKLGESAGEIDMSDVAGRVKENFAEPQVDRPTGMSPEDRAARAATLVSNRTVVGLVGSDWGAGEGGINDSLSSGLSRVKGGGDYGDLVVGGGGPGSTYLDGEDGGIADVVGAPGGGFGVGPGGPGGPGGPNLAAFKPEDIGPEKGPNKVSGIEGPKKKLPQAEKEKVKEKKFKLNLSAGRGFTGGTIDKAAVNKYLRARSSALQKCYVQVARKNPNVGGKLVLQIKIDLAGRATAKVVSDQTGDPRLGQCIVGKVKQWPFPKPAGKPVEFKIPFVFRAL